MLDALKKALKPEADDRATHDTHEEEEMIAPSSNILNAGKKKRRKARSSKRRSKTRALASRSGGTSQGDESGSQGFTAAKVSANLARLRQDADGRRDDDEARQQRVRRKRRDVSGDRPRQPSSPADSPQSPARVVELGADESSSSSGSELDVEVVRVEANDSADEEVEQLTPFAFVNAAAAAALPRESEESEVLPSDVEVNVVPPIGPPMEDDEDVEAFNIFAELPVSQGFLSERQRELIFDNYADARQELFGLTEAHQMLEHFYDVVEKWVRSIEVDKLPPEYRKRIERFRRQLDRLDVAGAALHFMKAVEVIEQDETEAPSESVSTMITDGSNYVTRDSFVGVFNLAMTVVNARHIPDIMSREDRKSTLHSYRKQRRRAKKLKKRRAHTRRRRERAQRRKRADPDKQPNKSGIGPAAAWNQKLSLPYKSPFRLTEAQRRAKQAAQRERQRFLDEYLAEREALKASVEEDELDEVDEVDEDQLYAYDDPDEVARDEEALQAGDDGRGIAFAAGIRRSSRSESQG